MTDEPTAEQPAAPTTPATTPTAAPEEASGGRRWLIRGILVVATVLAVISIFAVWANRQALNADNWGDTSSRLLEDPDIRQAVSEQLVDTVYANVNVAQTLGD